MREIKFRGKRIDNGEWVYGFYREVYMNYDFSHKCSEITYYDEYGFIFIWTLKVIPETVGQYTGLKDKNNKEIYEGDIINIHQTVNGCNLFEIVWDKTKWNAKYAVEMVKPRLYEYIFNDLLDVDVFEKEIEVVGNIYEKKEYYY